MQRQSNLSELIPKGLGTYWILFFAGTGFITLLEISYLYLPKIADTLGISTIAALDVSRRDSILNWFVSLLLSATAAVSFVNYQLSRKHQDPGGRTAAWFWAAMGFLYMSLDIQVALRETVGACLTQWSGTPLYGNGTAWWLIVYLFYFGIAGTRILSGMFAYPFLLGLFLLSITGITADIVLGLHIVPLPLEPEQMFVLQTAVFASAVLSLLLSCMLFARQQVFRDPDVALRWFAEHWKQESLLQKFIEPVPVKEEQNKPNVNKPSVVSVPGRETPLVAARPAVEKKQETVPFKLPNDGKKEKDFDLSGTG